MVITNSLARSSMACHADSSATGVRNVVRRTRRRLMPSMPRW
jgi:hypothetical protein